MFDIGFPELVIISLVALVVLGPERLPEALRTLGLWFGRARRSFSAVKSEIEREIGMDDVRRQLHNESIMEEMQRLEDDVHKIGQQAKNATGSVHAAAEDEAQAIQDAVLDTPQAPTTTPHHATQPSKAPSTETAPIEQHQDDLGQQERIDTEPTTDASKFK